MLLGVTMKQSARAIEERLLAHGAAISGLQYGILRTLEHHPLTLSELSRKFILDPSTLVPAVDALQRKGFIERGRDPKDRRRVPLSLTPAGIELLASVPPLHHDDLLLRSLAALGPEKTEQLARLLRELLASMPDGPAILCDVANFVQTHSRTLNPDPQPMAASPPLSEALTPSQTDSDRS